MAADISMRTTWNPKSPICSACPTVCASESYHRTNEGIEKRIRERLDEIKRLRSRENPSKPREQKKES